MYTKLRFSIDNLEDLKKTQSRFTLLFSIQKMKREMKGNINKHVVSILKAEGPISSEISWQTNKKKGYFIIKSMKILIWCGGGGGVLVLLVFFNFTAYFYKKVLADMSVKMHLPLFSQQKIFTSGKTLRKQLFEIGHCLFPNLNVQKLNKCRIKESCLKVSRGYQIGT